MCMAPPRVNLVLTMVTRRSTSNRLTATQIPEVAEVFEPFANEPYSDFSIDENAAAYRAAIEGVRAELGGHYPLIIGGEAVDTDDRIESVNPAKPSEVVGTVAAATPELAGRAIEAAWKGFAEWSAMTAEARARTVMKLAAILRRRKLEFSAWQTLEASKNYSEAEADVAPEREVRARRLPPVAADPPRRRRGKRGSPARAPPSRRRRYGRAPYVSGRS